MQDFKNDDLEQLTEHEAELQRLTVELNDSSKQFIDTDAEVLYIATHRRMIEELEEVIEQDNKSLAEELDNTANDVQARAAAFAIFKQLQNEDPVLHLKCSQNKTKLS